jgi:hypothetical protein
MEYRIQNIEWSAFCILYSVFHFPISPQIKTPTNRGMFLCPDRTISRILSFPRPKRGEKDGHLSWLRVAAELIASYQSSPFVRLRLPAGRPRTSGALALAPERVCRRRRHRRRRCVAVTFQKPHRITFHVSPDRSRNSMVSVALSLDLQKNVGRGMASRRSRGVLRAGAPTRDQGCIPSVRPAIFRPPLAAFHETNVAVRNGVRTFLPPWPKGLGERPSVRPRPGQCSSFFAKCQM